MAARVAHFEIHADDPERAVRFYTDAFGWSFFKWDGPLDYWMITTGPDDEIGINGGLMRRDSPVGSGVASFVCTLSVNDLDDALSKVRTGGGTVEIDKHPVPGIGWMSYCKDTEGNLFGMMQDDPSAA